MAAGLKCQMTRAKAGCVISLPAESAERAYMLFDALASGFLHSLVLQDGGEVLRCVTGAADMLELREPALQLSENTIGCIKRMLLDGALRPADTVWLHVDIETLTGDAVVRFEQHT